MRGFARKLFGARSETTGYVFSRPLVAIQSDDWGRVGVQDREGFARLRAKGINLGQDSYDAYSLETADDASALAAQLLRHRDSAGRPPCIVMSFCTANLDFPKMKSRGYKHIELLPLAKGLPGSWSRPGLFDAYRAGIGEGVFYPALHSLTHFCPVAIESALAENGERAALLRTFWEAETPYIFWRMPWVGYEYCNPQKHRRNFLPAQLQHTQVKKACECFAALFETSPLSACAPGYAANRDTHRAWSEAGIRIAQNGTRGRLSAPHIDHMGILHLYRTIDLEPSQGEVDVQKYVEIAGNCFSRGLPLIISTHSINFHSSIKDFRSGTLAALESVLTALEAKYPELLYVTDRDIYGIVTEGVFDSHNERITVSARQEWNPQLAHQGAL
ncbi:MAG TPA: hypothetical protein VJO35_01360 [Terriglobales bacterium]|nr:hypothetical protein [Terriglobales bacterium]